VLRRREGEGKKVYCLKKEGEIVKTLGDVELKRPGKNCSAARGSPNRGSCEKWRKKKKWLFRPATGGNIIYYSRKKKYRTWRECKGVRLRTSVKG